MFTVKDQIGLLNQYHATSYAVHATSYAVALVLETFVKTSHKACHLEAHLSLLA